MSFCLKIETKTLPRLGCFVRRLLYHGIKSDQKQNCAHRRTRVFIWYIYKCVLQKIPNRLKAFWLRARVPIKIITSEILRARRIQDKVMFARSSSLPLPMAPDCAPARAHVQDMYAPCGRLELLAAGRLRAFLLLRAKS